MDCMISHANQNIIYFSFQFGGLRKSTDGGATNTDIQPVGSAGTWVTPYIMDPSNHNILYAGYDDVYRSTNGGTSWTNKGAVGSSAMAMGTNNTARIYAADGNTLRMSSNSGNTWTDITGTWSAAQSVTDIAVNPDDDEDVFVTVNGYINNKKVYRSQNAGTSWANLTGSLPNVPHNCIAYEDTNGSPNDALYVGTDIGVFYRDNDLGDWIPFTNGLPTTEIRDLEINYGAGVIRAGTHGRSIWSSDLYSTCPATIVLTKANNPGQTNVSNGYQFYQASNYIRSSRLIGGGLVLIPNIKQLIM